MAENVDPRFDIADDETLFRLISRPGCISDDGVLSPDIFSLYHKNEFYVSMIRELYCSESDALKVGDFIKRWPFKGDEYFGLLKMNAEKIRNVSERIRLLSYYTENNPSHAGISYLNDDGTFITHTGDEVLPFWLLGIQERLCQIVDEIVKKG